MVILIMRNLILLSFVFIVFYSCDVISKCDGLACYPGAPEVFIEFIPNAGIDSSYFVVESWSITDSGNPVRIRYTSDSVWNHSDPFMNLVATDTSIQFFGTGIIWDNLDDLLSEITLDYGNSDNDDLKVEIGEATDNCCFYNFIDGVYFNEQELTLEQGTYFFKIYLNK